MLENSYPSCYHSVKMQEVEQSAGKLNATAYLLGVYLGDGCLTGKMYKLNVIDLDFAKAVQRALEIVLGKKPKIRTHAVKNSDKPNHAIAITAHELLYFVDDTQRKQKIPEYVFGWPKDAKLAFIAGVMDSEGWVSINPWYSYRDGKKRITKAEYESGIGRVYTGHRYNIGFKCTDGFTLDLPRLMESVGIKTNKITRCKPYKEGYLVPMKFHINKETWLKSGAYFNIKRKEDKLSGYRDTLDFLKKKNRLVNPSETTRSLNKR